jgi:class 3 adenylate cyclase
MTLREELDAQVAQIFRARWTVRDGTTVPTPEELLLGNDAVRLNATVLYADLAASTDLVDNYDRELATEIYKSFLLCAGRIIRDESGAITAYDGDRIMAVYLGNSKNTSAVRTALKINWSVHNIINPALKRQYESSQYVVRHRVGVDTSQLYIARTGFRGSNDLVWVGRAANHAAKLAALPPDWATYITDDVYENIHETTKVATAGENMWTPLVWTEFDRSRIYGSSYWWELT